MTSLMKSMKARAWDLAADLLEALTEKDGPPEEIEHIRVHVIPSLRQRARIIERNQKDSWTGP
jgi:hypothetical protein